LKFDTLVEICSAMHLTSEVVSDFAQRGGIMFVAPPGHLKTTAIEIVEQFPHARVISNLTVRALTIMRQDFLSGNLKTMAFSDYENIYRRHSSVAGNIEGVLMGLAEEGFRNPAFSDQRISVLPARCGILAAISIKAYEERISGWLDSGFARRFLWSKYYADDKVLKHLEHSIIVWKKIALANGFTLQVPLTPIKVSITQEQSEKMLAQLRFQPDTRTPFILAKKIMSVLLWRHSKKPERAWEVWNDFAESLNKDGTVLTLSGL
jgi:hypothetical protein